MWIDFVDFSEKSISRGCLLKFYASYPFDEIVVMMVCEAPDLSGKPGLMTITGHKAGINCYVVFPEEAQLGNCFLNVGWLRKNWNLWVCPDGSIKDVWVHKQLSCEDIGN